MNAIIALQNFRAVKSFSAICCVLGALALLLPAQTPFEARLLDILRAKDVCTEAEVNALRVEAAAAAAARGDGETLAAQVESLTAQLQDAAPVTGYKAGGGFHFSTADSKARMMVGGRVQVRFTSSSPEVGADRANFSTPRVRLWLEGHMFSPEWRYRIQPELAGPQVTITGAGTSAANFASLLDAWIEWKPSGAFSLRFGQWEVHYSRQQLIGYANQEFVDRWSNLGTFARGYQTGVGAAGGFGGEKGEMVRWSASALNGTGANVANADETIMGLARVSIDPLGPVGNLEGDFAGGDLRIQAGLNAWTMGNAGTDNTNCAGADLTLLWQGLYFTAEAHRRDNPTGSLLQRGFFAQAGYFFVPGVADVGLRYGNLEDYNSGGPVRVTESVATLGWYPARHDLKLQLDGGLVRSWATSGAVSDEFRLRFQVQMAF